MSLKTNNLQFLDMRSYSAPQTFYDVFVDACQCKVDWGDFAYVWFDSVDKLKYSGLPDCKHFYDTLKDKILVMRNVRCTDACKTNNMKISKHFLEWYDILAATPFVQAVEKIRVLYKYKHLDLFSDGVSLRGLVLKYLIKSTKDEFRLFDENNLL